MDRNVSVIFPIADKAAAEAIAAQYPGNVTFTVKLSTIPGSPVQTWCAVSGFIDPGLAAALEASITPIFKVRTLEDGSTFYQHIEACVPQLYICPDDEEV